MSSFEKGPLLKEVLTEVFQVKYNIGIYFTILVLPQ